LTSHPGGRSVGMQPCALVRQAIILTTGLSFRVRPSSIVQLACDRRKPAGLAVQDPR
jgi:hypothetical protein